MLPALGLQDASIKRSECGPGLGHCVVWLLDCDDFVGGPGTLWMWHFIGPER